MVASNIALLTGAQADPITFQYSQFAGYGLQMVSTGQGAGNGSFFQVALSPGNGPALSAPATFDGNSGTLSIPSSTIGFFCPGSGCVSVGGLVGNTYTAIGANTSTIQLTFGTNVLTGTMNITALEDNVSRPGVGFAPGVGINVLGDFTVTSENNPAFFSNFGGVGTEADFLWPLARQSPVGAASQTIASVFASGNLASGVFDQTNRNLPLGSITPAAAPPEIPLPPAIYLFGSVLGGAFWMSRRKRSAVSSLGVA